jgi:hypothetical protein
MPWLGIRARGAVAGRLENEFVVFFRHFVTRIERACRYTVANDVQELLVALHVLNVTGFTGWRLVCPIARHQSSAKLLTGATDEIAEKKKSPRHRPGALCFTAELLLNG